MIISNISTLAQSLLPSLHFFFEITIIRKILYQMQIIEYSFVIYILLGIYELHPKRIMIHNI